MWNYPANDLSIRSLTRVALRIKTKDFVEGVEECVDIEYGIKDYLLLNLVL